MTPNLVEALSTLTELTKTCEPMTSFITREVNLYLDVLRTYGKRDKLSETDVHILCARLLDLAQIAPLAGEAAPREPSQELPIALDMDAFGKSVNLPVGTPLKKYNQGKPIEHDEKPASSLKIVKPKAQPAEASDEARL